MQVLIKEGTKYAKISVDDLLQGLEEESIKKEVECKINVHPGIVKIEETYRGYKVRVWERNINRILTIGKIDKIQNGVITEKLMVPFQDKAFVNDLFKRVLEGTGFRYKTVNGAVIEMELISTSGGYRVDVSNVLIARTEYELGNTGAVRKFIYPNIYDNSSKICFGTTNLPIIKDFNEVGKITSEFFISKINSDLSNMNVNKVRWESMISELRDTELEVLEGFETQVEKLLQIATTARGATPGTNILKINFYFIMLIANICNKDMDWIHDRLYKN